MANLFEVGDQVRLRNDSEFYGGDGQVAGIGLIVGIYIYEEYPIKLDSLVGDTWNCYNPRDLEVV